MPHAAPIGTNLLQKEIRIIDQPRGQPPGAVTIVAAQDIRTTEEGRAGNLPIGRADMGEIPVTWQPRIEMRIVGNQGPACRGATGGNDPVVRTAADLTAAVKTAMSSEQAFDDGAACRNGG